MRREQDQHGASLWTANLHAWLAPCVDLRWGSTCRDAWNASCLVAGSTLGPKHAPRHQHKLDPLDPTPIYLQTPCEVLGCTTTVAHFARPHCQLFASSCLSACQLRPFAAAIHRCCPVMEDDNRDGFQLPAPPPPLQTRDNAMDRPGTPTEAFMSPQQTPQGSPSKHHQPPGAFDLPHVFENAMRLLPTMGSPSKTKPASPTSPNKLQLGSSGADYNAQDSPSFASPGSPTRKSNQENTPPSGRPGLQKESSYVTQAAQSRREPYRTREDGQSTRYINGPQRLSPEELEKARKPAVKRLANVTQLCKALVGPRLPGANTISRLSRLLLRSSHLRTQPPEPSLPVQSAEPASTRHTRQRVQRCPHTIPWPRACQLAQATHPIKAG